MMTKATWKGQTKGFIRGRMNKLLRMKRKPREEESWEGVKGRRAWDVR